MHYASITFILKRTAKCTYIVEPSKLNRFRFPTCFVITPPVEPARSEVLDTRLYNIMPHKYTVRAKQYTANKSGHHNRFQTGSKQ